MPNKYQQVLLLVAILGLVGSLYVFMVGWHNIDVAYNMASLKLSYNYTFIDATSMWGNFTSDQMHGIGMDYIGYAVLGVVFFGVVVGYLVKGQN